MSAIDFEALDRTLIPLNEDHNLDAYYEFAHQLYLVYPAIKAEISRLRAQVAELDKWKLNNYTRCTELVKVKAERDALEGRATILRDALEELVYLKDMKDRLQKLHDMGHGTDYDHYHKHKPLAWKAAKTALESSATIAATHDARVRNEAIEECAELCEGFLEAELQQFPLDHNETAWASYFSKHIRALKTVEAK